MTRILLALSCAAWLTACAREPGLFVEANARAHIGMLADTIGSRPVGTPENARARAYIIDQLKQIGMSVRVQEADARRQEIGVTAHVANIIAVLPGERPEGLALVTHYDSSPHAPGAADAALGVGVAIEAARVLASRPRRQWTLFVLITDGEEAGLLGAAALVTDRDVMDRLHAYINIESIGSSGTPVLFEAGPANGWIVGSWARAAPHPRGGSYAIEIYQRLPNDTDFSILKTREIPGLNFAPIGDSYAYHTARDTADRLSRQTIRETGGNVVSIASALMDEDITQRSRTAPTFFDVAGRRGVVYGPIAYVVLGVLGLLLGGVGWLRATRQSIRQAGLGRWIVALLWAWIGTAAAVASMVVVTWLLRSAREVYHPWYARPGRLFVLLILVGATVAWSTARLGEWLPRRLHPGRHPALTWSVTLPVWIGLAALTVWYTPAAAYLWVIPLLTSGLLLTALPIARAGAVRAASLPVFLVAAILWVPNTHDLLRFLVTVMGRFPIISPAGVYAGVIAACAVMVAPPLVALFAAERPLVRPWLVTALLLIASTSAFVAAYLAPAYTREQPLRRLVRVLQDGDAAGALWEVASVEPGLDLGEDAPRGWNLESSDPPASIPWQRLPHPFVFRLNGPPLGDPPIAIAGFATRPLPAGAELTLQVVPRQPGVTLTFVLPPGVSPVRTSLPGRDRSGRWTAVFVAPPPEGVAWTAAFERIDPAVLDGTRVVVSSSRLPGGTGWQSLPSWLPQETAVWTATAAWVVPATAGPGIAPVPPLR